MNAKLVTGSVRGHLLALTIPMSVGLFALMTKSLVDTYFVAQLGTNELSAISFTFPIILLMMSVVIGLGAGTVSVVSRTIGESDAEKTRRRATDALALAFVATSFAALIGYVSRRWVFSALGAEGEILELVLEYMGPWYLALVALVMPIVGNGLLRANGEAKAPGYVMLASALINAVLDPILIFGMFGAPELGIQGASLATLISNVVTSGAVLVFQLRMRLITLRVPPRAELMSSWSQIIKIGIPAAGANMINPLGLAMVTRIVASIGPVAVAGYGVGTKIESLTAVLLLSLSAAIGPMVGQNYGAHRPDRVDESIKTGFILCVASSAGCAALLALFADDITPLFDDSADVQSLATLYLWIVPATQFGYGMNIVMSAAFNALGRPLLSTALTSFRMAVYVPTAWALVGPFGATGVFMAAGLGNLAGGIGAWIASRINARYLAAPSPEREEAADNPPMVA